TSVLAVRSSLARAAQVCEAVRQPVSVRPPLVFADKQGVGRSYITNALAIIDVTASQKPFVWPTRSFKARSALTVGHIPQWRGSLMTSHYRQGHKQSRRLRTAHPRGHTRRHLFSPRLEALEDRCLLAGGSWQQTLAFPNGSASGTAVAIQQDSKVVV